MQTRFAAMLTLAILTCCVATACSSPGSSASAPPQAQAAPAADPVAGLVSKVWRQTSPADAPLSTLYIFLPGGTLVQTSCTEVYRLSTWRFDRDRTLTITEEPSPPFTAEFEVDGTRLRLRLKLGGEWQPWKTLEVATAPFVCPDLRR
jgi:hypothetical protein